MGKGAQAAGEKPAQGGQGKTIDFMTRGKTTVSAEQHGSGGHFN